VHAQQAGQRLWVVAFAERRQGARMLHRGEPGPRRAAIFACVASAMPSRNGWPVSRASLVASSAAGMATVRSANCAAAHDCAASARAWV
jgi:hypothetical protein